MLSLNLTIFYQVAKSVMSRVTALPKPAENVSVTNASNLATSKRPVPAKFAGEIPKLGRLFWMMDSWWHQGWKDPLFMVYLMTAFNTNFSLAIEINYDPNSNLEQHVTNLPISSRCLLAVIDKSWNEVYQNQGLLFLEEQHHLTFSAVTLLAQSYHFLFSLAFLGVI